jgi:predicted small integral membrane protein
MTFGDRLFLFLIASQFVLLILNVLGAITSDLLFCWQLACYCGSLAVFLLVKALQSNISERFNLKKSS